MLDISVSKCLERTCACGLCILATTSYYIAAMAACVTANNLLPMRGAVASVFFRFKSELIHSSGTSNSCCCCIVVSVR
jgi:hypothetical protein